MHALEAGFRVQSSGLQKGQCAYISAVMRFQEEGLPSHDWVPGEIGCSREPGFEVQRWLRRCHRRLVSSGFSGLIAVGLAGCATDCWERILGAMTGYLPTGSNAVGAAIERKSGTAWGRSSTHEHDRYHQLTVHVLVSKGPLPQRRLSITTSRSAGREAS